MDSYAQENGYVTDIYLKNLIELEIIKREFSVDDGMKERANTNRGLYCLTDNFFRFWYAFVFTNYSELESGDADGAYLSMLSNPTCTNLLPLHLKMYAVSISGQNAESRKVAVPLSENGALVGKNDCPPERQNGSAGDRNRPACRISESGSIP